MKTKVNKKTRVHIRHSAEMAALHQHANVKIKEVIAMFPQYSRATVYRHAKRPLGAAIEANKSHYNTGRPRKLSERDSRNILRAVKTLRETLGTFTSPRVAIEANIDASRVSNRTVRRELNRHGFKYRTTRRKGLMRERDFKERVKFCRKIKRRNLGISFWTEHVSFFLDGVGFEYKKNPFDNAKAPKSREWRKIDEGLIVTRKGKKEGCKNSNFMVGISYNKGVVLCANYTGSITGEKMANIAKSHFPNAFERSNAPRAKRVIMDGCTRQNSKQAFKAYGELHAKMMILPPRSPDLNPIENFFNIVKVNLKNQAIASKKTAETFEEFTLRVKTMLETFPVDIIDKIILSMDKRINLVLESKGRRIRY